MSTPGLEPPLLHGKSRQEPFHRAKWHTHAVRGWQMLAPMEFLLSDESRPIWLKPTVVHIYIQIINKQQEQLYVDKAALLITFTYFHSYCCLKLT